MALVLDRAQPCIGEKISDRAALVPPAIEGVFPEKDIVPVGIATLFRRKGVDPVSYTHLTLPTSDLV